MRLLILLLIVSSCSQDKKKTVVPTPESIQTKIDTLEVVDTLETIEAVDFDHLLTQMDVVDSLDTNYVEYWAEACKDQYTYNGYWLKFRVIDSTKYDDLHMFWGKDSVIGYEYLENLTSIENYEFVPGISRQTDDFLILEHACGKMGCWGIQLLSKTDTTKYQLFGVYEEDYEAGLILHGLAWDLNSRTQVEIFDLRNCVNHIVDFGEFEHVHNFNFHGDSAIFTLVDWEDSTDVKRGLTYVVPRD